MRTFKTYLIFTFLVLVALAGMTKAQEIRQQNNSEAVEGKSVNGEVIVDESLPPLEEILQELHKSTGQGEQGISPLSVLAGRQYYYWVITITGNSGGQNFQRQGYLLLTTTITSVGTTNGVNPYDFWLISGDPFASPSTGSICFLTNTALIGGAAQVDMAYVSYYPSSAFAVINPDGRLAQLSVNGFNVNSGLTANAYTIFDGAMQIQFLKNFQSVYGKIDVSGTTYYIPTTVKYQATFTGIYGGFGIFQ